jgi:hypothetical protein
MVEQILPNNNEKCYSTFSHKFSQLNTQPRSYRAGGRSRRGAATALGLGGSCLLRRARMAANWCGQKLRLEVPISIF